MKVRGRDEMARARPIRGQRHRAARDPGRPSSGSTSRLDAVFIRKDPPFDSAYLYLTQLLDLVKTDAGAQRPARPARRQREAVRLPFQELMPRTLVSAKPREILEFVGEVGGRAVIKPLDGAGGSGVMALAPRTEPRALIDV